MSITAPTKRQMQSGVLTSSRAAGLAGVPDFARRSHGFAIALMVLWLCLPTIEMHIGIKLTPGRIAILLLLFPAIFTFFQKERQAVASDYFLLAMVAWIIATSYMVEGFSPSSYAILLEFAGGYMVARAFVFGRPALQTFIAMLKIAIVPILFFAILDSLSGRLFTWELAKSFLPVPPQGAQHRMGMVRAASVFDTCVMFGTFCVMLSAMFLYSERNILQRALYVGMCSLGVVLTVSSAPLLGFLIVATVYAYDCFLARFPWRWRALGGAITAVFVAIFLTANRPISWIVAHLTLDPQSGYFRIAQWHHATAIIADSPYIGYAFREFGNKEVVLDQAGWDSVWLVVSVRHGIPAIILLIALNFAAFVHFGRKAKTTDPFMQNMKSAFTLVLMVYCFIGLTVHFWLSMWLFWGMCAGIRASLKEYDLGTVAWRAPQRTRPRLKLRPQPS